MSQSGTRLARAYARPEFRWFSETPSGHKAAYRGTAPAPKGCDGNRGCGDNTSDNVAWAGYVSDSVSRERHHVNQRRVALLTRVRKDPSQGITPLHVTLSG